MKYFSIKELTHSDVAERKGVDNTPDKQVESNLKALIINVLEPIREKYNSPIYVNSGYRCPELNALIGGVSTSQHLTGEAVDISTRDRINNEKLFNIIKDMVNNGELIVDQLIDEFNLQWIHISFKKDGNNRNQILTIC